MDLSIAQIDKALRRYVADFGAQNHSWAARAACDVQPVDEISGYHYRVDTSNALSRSRTGVAVRMTESVVGPGSNPLRLDDTISLGQYSTVRMRVAIPVPDELRAVNAPALRPLLRAARKCLARLHNDTEILLARVAGVIASYPAANRTLLTTGGAGTSWRSYGSTASSPLTNIQAGAAIMDLAGAPANGLLLTGDVARTLADHPEVRDIVKYTDDRWLWGSGLPARIRNLRVIVSRSPIETATPGGASVPAYALRDTTNNEGFALLLHLPEDDGDVGSFTLFDGLDCTTGERAVSLRQYRSEDQASTIVEALTNVDIRATIVNAGGEITGGYLIYRTLI